MKSNVRNCCIAARAPSFGAPDRGWGCKVALTHHRLNPVSPLRRDRVTGFLRGLARRADWSAPREPALRRGWRRHRVAGASRGSHRGFRSRSANPTARPAVAPPAPWPPGRSSLRGRGRRGSGGCRAHGLLHRSAEGCDRAPRAIGEP